MTDTNEQPTPGLHEPAGLTRIAPGLYSPEDIKRVAPGLYAPKDKP